MRYVRLAAILGLGFLISGCGFRRWSRAGLFSTETERPSHRASDAPAGPGTVTLGQPVVHGPLERWRP